MGADDWYRSSAWDEAAQAAFWESLGRSRDKPQHLRLKASNLVDSHPKAALGLLEQYFAHGEHFDIAQACVDRAKALVNLRDLEAAFASYRAALMRERQFPSLKTQAYLDFPTLVLSVEAEHLYGEALNLLDLHRDRPALPVDRYKADGARALFLMHFGRKAEAKVAAASAISAARETQSPYRNHPHLGLVHTLEGPFANAVAAIAGEPL